MKPEVTVKLRPNQKEVTLESLRGKGQFYYPFVFRQGEQYYVPNPPTCIEEQVPRKGGEDLFITKVLMARDPNGEQKSVLVPVNSFISAPDSSLEDRSEFIETYEANRELFLLKDIEQRVLFMAEKCNEGYVLQVKEFVTLKRATWKDGSRVCDENGNPVCVPHKYPVFEWVK